MAIMNQGGPDDAMPAESHRYRDYLLGQISAHSEGFR
jgi:hypothetical protein